MGGVNSGLRGWRGGRRSASCLPVAKISYRNLYAVGGRGGNPTVIPGVDGFASVSFNFQTWVVRTGSTPLHFGGFRRWLICPECDSLRQALYVDKKRLACRCCLGLRYDTQHENRRQRAIRSVDKTRAILGWMPGLVSPNGSKPKGMHWRTYSRLRERLDGLSDAVFVNISAWIDRRGKQG